MMTEHQNPHSQSHARRALILYGSQTGNSQEVAEDLGRMAERLHFITRVCEMDLLDLNSLSQYTVVVFTVSTTGQGEFPRNARQFWKSLLKKRLPPGCLSHVEFTTFGLGDSSYAKFNWSARKLHKRLGQLGAKEIYPRGEADEQDEEGIDGTFLPWSADFRNKLLSLYPLPEGVTPISPETFLRPKFKLVLLEEQEEAMDHPDQVSTMDSEESPSLDLVARPANASNPLTQTGPSSQRPPSTSTSVDMEPRRELVWTLPEEPVPPVVCAQLKEQHPDTPVPIDRSLPAAELLPIEDSFNMKVLSNKRLTPEKHWQDVREITFIMNVDDVRLLPGDAVTIYPKNFPEDVDALIELMDWQSVADKPLKLQPEAPNFLNDDSLITLLPPSGLHALKNTTLRQLLTHNLDITAIPNRHFFETIANFTDDQTHKDRLLEFANPIYTDEFYDYTSRPRRSILEVLQDFPTVKLPWIWACSIFPVIRGREYSIASGGTLHKYRNKAFTKFQILVAIVKYRTVLKKVRQGLCSRYLASLAPNTLMNGTFYNGGVNHFYAPVKKDRTVDTICICAGTGLAPIRALLWERAAVKQPFPIADKPNGHNLLIFGCRNPDADFFYRDEWTYEILRTKVLTAFSRERKEKVYVQDVIRANKALICSILGKKGTVVYVAGSSGRMPKAVREALVEALAEGYGGLENGEECLMELERDGRYLQETW